MTAASGQATGTTQMLGHHVAASINRVADTEQAVMLV
jgi:hypothetical protein